MGRVPWWTVACRETVVSEVASSMRTLVRSGRADVPVAGTAPLVLYLAPAEKAEPEWEIVPALAAVAWGA